MFEFGGTKFICSLLEPVSPIVDASLYEGLTLTSQILAERNPGFRFSEAADDRAPGFVFPPTQGNFKSTLEFLIPFLFFFCRKVKTFLKQKSTEMNVFFFLKNNKPSFFSVDTLFKPEPCFFCKKKI